jgi:hypothetical protein
MTPSSQAGLHSSADADGPWREVTGPQCEPFTIRGRQRRGRRRPQRADPLQDLLGHGDRGQVAEKEGPQGHGGRRNSGRQRGLGDVRGADHRAEEYGLQVFLLTRMAAKS